MTGSILKRGDKTYLIRLSLGKDQVTGKRLYRTQTVHGTKKEAEARLRALVSEYEGGTLVSKSTQSLNEFLQKWLATTKGRVRSRTAEDYEGLWNRYLKDGLGRLPLSKVTTLKIQTLYGEMLDRGLSPSTVRRLHTVINPALRQAVRWKMLGHNPAADVDLPANRANKVMRTMTLEEAQAFLKATLEFKWGAILRFAVRTGMRPEEYLGLQWSDVDWTGSVARITKVLVKPKGGGWKFDQPKTAGSVRTVALSQADLDDLRDYRALQIEERAFAGSRWNADHDFVFTSQTGGPVNLDNLAKRAFKPALKLAGLPTTKFRLYDLRHTCATLLFAGGEHPKVVSERLGHANISITLDTYSHVLPTMQAAAASKLGEMLPNPSPGASNVIRLDRQRAKA